MLHRLLFLRRYNPSRHYFGCANSRYCLFARSSRPNLPGTARSGRRGARKGVVKSGNIGVRKDRSFSSEHPHLQSTNFESHFNHSRWPKCRDHDNRWSFARQQTKDGTSITPRRVGRFVFSARGNADGVPARSASQLVTRGNRKRFRSKTFPEAKMTLSGRRTKAGGLCLIALLIFCGTRIAVAQNESSEDLAKKLPLPSSALRCKTTSISASVL
jgi:hypothetical protein